MALLGSGRLGVPTPSEGDGGGYKCGQGPTSMRRPASQITFLIAIS